LKCDNYSIIQKIKKCFFPALSQDDKPEREGGLIMNVMEVSEEVLWARLRIENPEFQKWEEEHHKLESTLASIDSHVYLTPEEEMERKRVQKLKLAAKDKMMEMIRRYKVGRA
jgi:uncharacterized protein YdcH (DUF465 family)